MLRITIGICSRTKQMHLIQSGVQWPSKWVSEVITGWATEIPTGLEVATNSLIHLDSLHNRDPLETTMIIDVAGLTSSLLTLAEQGSHFQTFQDLTPKVQGWLYQLLISQGPWHQAATILRWLRQE